jgi:uncharacterized membrane protein (DUF106 family)
MSFWEKFKEFDKMMSEPAFYMKLRTEGDNEEVKQLRAENNKLKLMISKLMEKEIRVEDGNRDKMYLP